MSVWTQVKGSINVRNITEKQIREKLGTPFSYEDMCGGVEKNNPIPYGSEGSIKYSINETVDEIRFKGNLRDYSNYDEILAWIQRLADVDEEDGFDNCIQHAEVELSIGEPPHQYIYNGFETKGSWWDEYRIIPQKLYDEKIGKLSK